MTSQIAPQTKILFLAYMLLLVSMVIQAAQKGFAKNTFFGLLMFILFALLGLYTTNCTVFGNCQLYAWIVSYVMFGMAVLSCMLLAFMIWRKV